MASSIVGGGDKYRDYLSDEELKNTKWRNGPPSYDVVDKLFEQERTHVWAEGSVEEKVQRLLKTWEMEIVHKADPNDLKTMGPNKFTISVNGPPEIVYKFRHWGYMEGPFKGHATTGQLVEFFGIGTFELDKESNKIIKAEMFFDRGELLGGLVKGESNGDQSTLLDASKCPFMK